MKQGTGDKVQGTVLTVLLIALTIRYMLYPVPSYAQDSSPSGSLIQKLNDLKNDIASKAAQIKNEVTQKVQNKAIIGSIINISDTEVTIQTLNAAKIIRYDEFTEILGAKNKKIEIDTLEIDDKIAALGDVDDKNNLVAQRLIYLENFASNSAVLLWGQIQKTSGNVITVKTQSGDTKNLITNFQTNFFLGNEEASILDTKVEKFLVARALTQKDGSLKARYIYFIPSKGFTKPTEKSPNKSATSSASQKP